MRAWKTVTIAALVLLAAAVVMSAGDPGWTLVNEDEGYTARHECSFVQAGDRFYLFGAGL